MVLPQFDGLFSVLPQPVGGLSEFLVAGIECPNLGQNHVAAGTTPSDPAPPRDDLLDFAVTAGQRETGQTEGLRITSASPPSRLMPFWQSQPAPSTTRFPQVHQSELNTPSARACDPRGSSSPLDQKRWSSDPPCQFPKGVCKATRGSLANRGLLHSPTENTPFRSVVLQGPCQGALTACRFARLSGYPRLVVPGSQHPRHLNPPGTDPD